MDSFEFYYNLDSYNKNSLIHRAENSLKGTQKQNVKYYKREGTPGKYKYFYTKEEYEASKNSDNSDNKTNNDAKKNNKSEKKSKSSKSIYTQMQKANKINNAKMSSKYDKKFVDIIQSKDKMTKEERVEEYKNYLNDPENYDEDKYIENRLTKISEGGNVNLNLRPEISTQELIDAGWPEKEVGEGYATVFSSTFSNESEDKAYNFTPIMMDPKTGEYLGCMSPEEFEDYVYDIIDNGREDDKNCQIGGVFEGEDAIKQAERIAEQIHDLHEQQHINEENKKKNKSNNSK